MSTNHPRESTIENCIALSRYSGLMHILPLIFTCACFYQFSGVLQGDDEAQKAAAQAEFEEILAEAKQKAAEEEVAEKASGSEDPDAPTTAEAEAEAEAYDGIEIVDQGNDAPGESSSGNESEGQD